MFKTIVFVAIIALAYGAPAPEAKPEAKADPKPHLVAAAYTSPVVASPVAYTAAYTAPVAYASYVAPSVYAAGYTAYSPYTAPYVVV